MNQHAYPPSGARERSDSPSEDSQAFYEARPMVGIEFAAHANKAWMVVETNRPHGGGDNIVAWSYQGRPEHNEANARMVARALNNQRPPIEAWLDAQAKDLAAALRDVLVGREYDEFTFVDAAFDLVREYAELSRGTEGVGERSRAADAGDQDQK